MEAGRRSDRPPRAARQRRCASYVAVGQPSPLYRNSVGDECAYVESGSATVETVFDILTAQAGDYVVLRAPPRTGGSRPVPIRCGPSSSAGIQAPGTSTLSNPIWAACGRVTVHTMARARGWALYFGATLLALGLTDDPVLAETGRRTLERACRSVLSG